MKSRKFRKQVVRTRWITTALILAALTCPCVPIHEPATAAAQAATNAVLVQAEDYDRFYDTTANNVGMMYRFGDGIDVDIEPTYDLSYDGVNFNPGYLYGHNFNNGFRVNSISNNEWLEYDVDIPVTDTWKFTFRMARLFEGTASFDFEIDGQPVASSPFTINSTGHHHIFQDVVVNGIHLTSGDHVVKVTFHGEPYDLAEFDWFYIESETNPPEPLTPTPKDYGAPPVPPPNYVSPVSQYGRLQVSGVDITSSVTGNPVQLRGVSPHGIQWFPTIDDHTIPNLAYDVGAQITRVPMYVEQFGGYTFGPTAKNYMIAKTDEMIQDAIDAGVYTSVSFHVHVDPTPYTEDAKEFFGHVAEKWGGHPNVVYEIVNESDGGTWKPIKDFADQIVPVIRDIETARGWDHNLIVVGTPTWCQQPHLAGGDPIDDVNIAYSFHWYAAGHPNSLWNNIDTAREAGLCVIVTEWGTGSWDWASRGYDLNDSEAFLAFLDQRGISWMNWAWNIKGEVLSSLKWTSTMSGPWPDEELTESGLFIKGKLPPPPPPPLMGDVNSDGFVDIVDALLVAQYYVEQNPDPFDESVADVNRDGLIDIVDALLIAQIYVGLLDPEPPTVPTGLTSPSQTANSIDLTWTASTDNVGVVGYDVYRDGALVGSSTSTSYTDSGLTAGTAYQYQVRARDADNASDLSSGITVWTKGVVTEGCNVTYDTPSTWSDGFTIQNVYVTNLGNTAIDGWTLTWRFTLGEQVTSAWNADVDQSGADVTATNVAHNGTIPAGGTVTFGFNGSQSNGVGDLVDFTLNGMRCGDTE